MPNDFTGFPNGTSSEDLALQCKRNETWVLSISLEDPLEEGMATHSSIPDWRIL